MNPQSRAGVPPASGQYRSQWNFARADALARQAGRLPYVGRAINSWKGMVRGFSACGQKGYP